MRTPAMIANLGDPMVVLMPATVVSAVPVRILRYRLSRWRASR